MPDKNKIGSQSPSPPVPVAKRMDPLEGGMGLGDELHRMLTVGGAAIDRGEPLSHEGRYLRKRRRGHGARERANIVLTKRARTFT